MAIEGFLPQLAEWGRIKIGGLGDERPKKNKPNETYRDPLKFDYIVITTMQRNEAGRLMADRNLMEILAKEGGPTIPGGPYKGLPLIDEIPIRLLYDDIDLNFMTRYAFYQGSRCWCSGNGKTAQRLDEKDGNYKEVQCPCERKEPLYTPPGGKCLIMGTLQALIEGTNRIGGVWKFRTRGWNSVNAILSSMIFMKTITGGPLAGILLHMVGYTKTATVPGTGKNVPIYVVSLEYRGTCKKHLEIGDGKSLEVPYSGREELAELGYEISRKRIESGNMMKQIEDDARRTQVLPQAESAEEQAQTAAEFSPRSFSTDGEEAGQGAGTDHTDQNGEGPDTDHLNLDRATAPEQVFTIPRETMRLEESVPPGYDGQTAPPLPSSNSKNGGRNSLF